MSTFQDSNPQRYANPVWRCGDGQRIHVKDLTDDHLKNIQRKLATHANDVHRAVCDWGHYQDRSYGIANSVTIKSFRDLEELERNIQDWIGVIGREVGRRYYQPRRPEQLPSWTCRPITDVPLLAYEHWHEHRHSLEAPSHHNDPVPTPVLYAHEHTHTHTHKHGPEVKMHHWSVASPLPYPQHTIRALREQVADRDKQLGHLRRELKESAVYVTGLEASIESLRREQPTESRCWITMERHENLMADATADLKARLKVVGTDRNRWQKRHHALGEELNAAQRDRDCWREKFHGLEAGLKVAQEMCDRLERRRKLLEGKLQAARNAWDCWREEERERKSQISSLKGKLRAVTEERDRWRKRYYRRCEGRA